MFVIKKIDQLLLTAEKPGDVNVYCSQPDTTKTCDVNRYALFQHSNAFRELRPKSLCVMQELKT